MMSYMQQSMFGSPEKVEIIPKYKPTQDEINEYYKTHTLLETVRHFGCEYNKLKVDPALKKNRRGAAIGSLAVEAQIVFLKTFTNISNRALARQFGIHHETVAEIERRHPELKNLFEEYMLQLGNAYGQHMLDNIEPIMAGMDNILAEALSKKKVKASSFKELIDGWSKLHSDIMEYIPREESASSGDVNAKNQLMDAIAEAVKADEMDRPTAESIYYKEEEENSDEIT